MKTTIDNLKISVVLAVVGIGGGAWWLSALHSDVQNIKMTLADVKSDVRSLLKQSEVVKTDSKHGVAKCAVNSGPYSAR